MEKFQFLDIQKLGANGMSVKKVIIDTIKAHQLSSFTLDELRELIYSQQDELPSSLSNKSIYKNIWNLKKEGMFELLKGTDSKQNVYLVTSLMQEQYLKETEESYVVAHNSQSMSFSDSLSKRLNEYSSELATTSAEIQEYQEIINIFPDQLEVLSQNCHKAKERALQLRGRLHAIENLMKSQPL